MADLVFYEDERKRWPELHDISITDEWAQRALKKLTRHFKADQLPYGTGPVKLEFGGRRISWGGRSGITLARSRDWLVFLHEFAHVYEYRKYGETYHRRRMAKIVDRVCRYALKMGWAERDLEEQFEAWCKAEEAVKIGPALAVSIAKTYEDVPAQQWPEPLVEQVPVPAFKMAAQAHGEREARLEHKRAQLARLERKIKNLTTRAKKVKRSIAGLTRALQS